LRPSFLITAFWLFHKSSGSMNNLVSLLRIGSSSFAEFSAFADNPKRVENRTGCTRLLRAATTNSALVFVLGDHAEEINGNQHAHDGTVYDFIT
jgi:hypothetical protein